MTAFVATEQATTFTDNTSPKSFTGLSWTAGDVVCVMTISESGNNAGFNFGATPTNANLSFGAATTAGIGSGAEAGFQIYTAIAASTQSGQTITVTRDNGYPGHWGAKLWIVAGAVGVANVIANTTEGTISRTVSADSVCLYGFGDFIAGTSDRTIATGSGTPQERDDGDGTGVGWFFGDWTDVAAGTFSFGVTSYAGLQVSHGFVEVTSEQPINVTTAGTGNSATSTATLAFDCGTAFAVGDIIVVAISADNNGASGISSLSSVADAGGNAYELLQATYDPGAAAAGQTVGIAWAKIRTPLVTTDDVTISFSPNTVSKAAVVYRLRPGAGFTLQKVTSAFTAGSATGTPTVTTSSITSGDVVVAVLAAESNAAVTQDADATNGAWTTQATAVGNSGTSATSSRVASQAKVVTATATQTYNPTITSCDNILGWITFTPTVTPIGRGVMVPSIAVHHASLW